MEKNKNATKRRTAFFDDDRQLQHRLCPCMSHDFKGRPIYTMHYKIDIFYFVVRCDCTVVQHHTLIFADWLLKALCNPIGVALYTGEKEAIGIYTPVSLSWRFRAFPAGN